VEGKIMGDIIAAGAVLTVLLLPVLWRASEDRAVARASIIRADIDHVVRSALGGESLVAVEVRPSGVTRRGQVILSVPGGWEALVEHSVRDVMAHLPDRYDLVVRAGARSEAKVA
jgi:hypothetical protein